MPGVPRQFPRTVTMSPASQSIALPDEILQRAESQWLFSDAELRRTPSILDGMPAERERANRGKGVNFILQVGVMLRLPQTTLAAASVFLHRFYMRYSMVEGSGKLGYHYYPMAATSLFLATKVEETCRKMKELVIACVRVAQKEPNKAVDEQDREYWRWRDNILMNEDLLLEALCFDLSLESPYATLFRLLVRFGADQNKRLRNAAWAFVNDGCLTMLCLMVPSKAVAASALFAGARLCGATFPDDIPGRPWWQVVGVDSSDILKACNYMCDVYEDLPLRSSRESGLYDRVSTDSTAAMDFTRQGGEHREGSAMSNGNSHQSLPGRGSPSRRRQESLTDARSDEKKNEMFNTSNGLGTQQEAASLGKRHETTEPPHDLANLEADNVSEEGEVES